MASSWVWAVKAVKAVLYLALLVEMQSLLV
jgi:hypothetical protein